jgi:outer membrane protein TolC
MARCADRAATLYASEKTLVAAQLTRASNRVGLYRALGGDSAALHAVDRG